MDNRDIIIVIGNPGYGKSSLLNALAQKKIFKSGISIGTGLTQHCETFEDNRFILVDTPGLNDCDRIIRENAAKEIKQCFETYKGKNVKIIFMITLECGRLRPSDNLLIILIHQAINMGSNYSIIFNKLEKSVMNKFEYKSLNGYNLIPTNSILLRPYNPEMDGIDNYLGTVDNELINFIINAPYHKIPKDIENIRHETFEIDIQYLEEKLRMLTNECDKLKDYSPNLINI